MSSATVVITGVYASGTRVEHMIKVIFIRENFMKMEYKGEKMNTATSTIEKTMIML